MTHLSVWASYGYDVLAVPHCIRHGISKIQVPISKILFGNCFLGFGTSATERSEARLIVVKPPGGSNSRNQVPRKTQLL